ncbi:hypothetical protein TRAPUB_5113 [Trametes pubescens]|uniref:Uncharacterized protein n=1 Tax=Trametes pubescens TaxID=154538 RepID=A0A1M2V9K1_TRAPU|nr:hypothetical protein TRAPUB_5113 [Trametes pubescens]
MRESRRRYKELQRQIRKAEEESNRNINDALVALGLNDIFEEDDDYKDQHTLQPNTPAAAITEPACIVAGNDDSEEPPMEQTTINTHLSDRHSDQSTEAQQIEAALVSLQDQIDAGHEQRLSNAGLLPHEDVTQAPRNMIDEMVGPAPIGDPPAYLKVAKLPPPKTYDGKDDLDALEVWLRGLLEYLNTLRIMGPELDRERVRILGQAVSGEAANWLYNIVQSPSREKKDWLFEEVVIAMYRRFIHKDLNLKAEQQYASLKYKASEGGVAALYERLLYTLV